MVLPDPPALASVARMIHTDKIVSGFRKEGRLHIAFILPNLSGGGAQRSVLNLAGGLIDRGHRVDVVLFRARIHYPKEVPKGMRLFVVENRPDRRTEESAAEVLASLVQLRVSSRHFDWMRMARALNWDPLCLPGPRLVRQARAVASYMALEKPDCVLPSLSRPNIAALLACHFLAGHPPIIPTFRTFAQYRRRRYRRRYRHLLASAAHFVGVSQGISDGLATNNGVPSESIVTIYNPVVTPDLQAKMAEHPKHPWLLDGGAPVVLAAGRLSQQKDYPTLIKAFARLASRRSCRLIVLGEGRLRKALERLVKDLRLTDRVSLPGWVENPFAFMSRASLFVLSSRYEGLPGVLVQALACGCPCVSTDCPAGPSEILQDGKFGPLVPVGDEEALAEAMDRILDEPPDGSELQRRAGYFSLERSVAAYEKLIATIV